jgi:molybdopterin-guanine dinucleotide biosynthesis protein A
LLSAIADCGRDRWLFLTACDWVGIRAEWALPLLERRSAEAQAVVYKGEHYEPLFALYHTSIRGTVADAIEADRLELRDVFNKVATATLPPPEGWSGVTNLNRPPD